MRRRGVWSRETIGLFVGVFLGFSTALHGQGDPDRLRRAKVLVFDRKYVEARQLWQEILASSKGAESELAAYWLAHCSEKLGEQERALKEFDEFLARRPADRTLVEQARTSRVGLAARLVKGGKRDHLGLLHDALADSSKTVRYYTALQLCGLGSEHGKAAVPVLQQIAERESDSELVERAKVCLLKLDPASLGRSARDSSEGLAREVRWIKVRIYEKGRSAPEVSVNLPLALAEMVFKSLPDEAKRELRKKGYDADNFWSRLRKLGPMEIIDIEGGDGEKIKIWIE